MLNKTSAYCKGLMVVQFKHASKEVRTQRSCSLPLPDRKSSRKKAELGITEDLDGEGLTGMLRPNFTSIWKRIAIIRCNLSFTYVLKTCSSQALVTLYLPFDFLNLHKA